jgi:hypothetical protein
VIKNSFVGGDQWHANYPGSCHDHLICIYPKIAVPKMGNFTQNWYGKKWVKILQICMIEGIVEVILNAYAINI